MADKQDAPTSEEAKASSENEPGNTAETLEETFKALRAALQRAEIAHVLEANLDQPQRSAVQERLYKMIDYTVKRQDWYADQCHRLLQIGLALIATGVAVIAFLVRLQDVDWAILFVGALVGLSLFCTGLELVFIFNNNLARDHPYRKVVDITSWFYAYRFPNPLSVGLSSDSDIARGQVQQEATFIERYSKRFMASATDADLWIREDIEQVAILLILQRYKSQQTKQMSQRLFAGLRVTAILLVLAIFTPALPLASRLMTPCVTFILNRVDPYPPLAVQRAVFSYEKSPNRDSKRMQDRPAIPQAGSTAGITTTTK